MSAEKTLDDGYHFEVEKTRSARPSWRVPIAGFG